MSRIDTERPMPSASVILARDGADGLEVLMVRRHRDTAFGSADAFPGGKVCADDAEVDRFCDGIDAAEADRRLVIDSGGIDYYSAAIRELFEETGVLLARAARQGDPLDVDAFESHRVALAEGRLAWPCFLEDSSLVLATDTLHYVRWWEAPLFVSPRFSTRFFVVVRPDGQHVRHDGREIVDSRWIAPSAALDGGRGSRLNLQFPTRKNLEMIAGFGTVADLIGWARDRWREGIGMTQGRLIEKDGQKRIVLPGDPDYPEQES